MTCSFAGDAIRSPQKTVSFREMNSPTPSLLAVVLAAVSLAANGQAAVIATDSFNYTVGSNLNGQNGGTGWSGSWTASTVSTSIVSGGLSYSSGSVQVNGGSTALQVGASASSDNASSPIVRQFSAQSSSDFYFSFLVSSPYGSPATNDDYFSVWLGNATPNPFSAANVFQAYERLLTGTTVGFGANAEGVTSNASYSSLPNTVSLVVGRITTGGPSGSGSNYDRLELYINPSSAVLPSTPDAAANVASGGLASIDRIGLRFALLDNSSDLYLVDNLTVGTTFASVVPEVRSTGLCGAAGLVLGAMAFRRRLAGRAGH